MRTKDTLTTDNINFTTTATFLNKINKNSLTCHLCAVAVTPHYGTHTCARSGSDRSIDVASTIVEAAFVTFWFFTAVIISSNRLFLTQRFLVLMLPPSAGHTVSRCMLLTGINTLNLMILTS